MAKIILSGMISDITGSIGGTTYAKFRNVHVAKSKCTQPKANSRWRMDVTALASLIVTQWKGLTDSERAEWTAYALFRRKIKHKNFPIPQTGYDLFRSINFYRYGWDGSFLLNPVFDSYDVDTVVVNSVTGHPDYTIDLDRALIPADEVLIVKLSSPLPDSIALPGSRLKAINGTTAAAATWDFESGYGIRFGNVPSLGQKIFVSVAVMSLNSGFMYPFSMQRFELT